MKNLKTFDGYNESINGMHPSTDYKVGDFLVGYYRGKNGGVTNVYRIAKVGHSDYTVMDIQKNAGLSGTPQGVDDSEIINGDFKGDVDKDYCFEYVYNELVGSMILDIEKKDAINHIMKTPHGISGIESGKEEDYWMNTEPVKVAYKYARDINKDKKTIMNFKVIRLLDNGKVIYNPFGHFRAWGHKPVNFKHQDSYDIHKYNI